MKRARHARANCSSSVLRKNRTWCWAACGTPTTASIRKNKSRKVTRPSTPSTAFFYTKTARRPTTVIVRTLAIVQLVRAELNCLRKPRTSARQTTRTRVCKPRKLYVCVRPSRLSRRGIFLTPRKRPSFGGETARPVLRARQLQVFSNAIFKRTRSPRAADAISSRW